MPGFLMFFGGLVKWLIKGEKGLLGKYFFQMEYLILCEAFALVLEVKSRIGEYLFEKYLNQATLKYNGHDERVKNPVLQARLQAMKLKKWLHKHKLS